MTGRVVRADGVPVPPVVLLSYRLSGTITDASGKPVAGAYVVSRTNDRDYWTFSEPTNAAGKYVSFFPASDLTEADPVEFSIQAAVGRTSYTTGVRNPTFKRRSSAVLDLKLPGSGVAMPLPVSTPVPGAIYRGTLDRRLGRNRRRAAGLGHLARRAGPVPADPAGVGCGQDAAVLAERLPDLPDERRHARWRGRPQGVADGAVAARRARHRLPPRLEVEHASHWPPTAACAMVRPMLSGTRIDLLAGGSRLLALALLLPR